MPSSFFTSTVNTTINKPLNKEAPMVSAKDVQGVMAMMPSFSTENAGDLTSKNTVDVDNLKAGVDRMINDGIDVITTTGSFGECYNLDWDEYKTLAVAAVDAVKKRVPLFIGATSPNAREVVERLKFVQDIGGDGTLLGVPYYDAQSPDYMADFYTQIAELFPRLGFLIYHNPVNHKVRIPVAVFPRLIKCPNISVMTNQAQVVPYYRIGAAGCWSIDAWMGPWPVLHLRNLARAGKDQEGLQVIREIMAVAGGERPGGNEGATAKLPIEFAGYVNPGPARTPIVNFSDTTIERAKKKAEGWNALCAKYRPLVEAERNRVKAAS